MLYTILIELLLVLSYSLISSSSIDNDTLEITNIIDSSSRIITVDTDSNEKKKLDPIYCNRPWPALELFLPVCLTRGRDIRRHYEVETLFIRSLLLFWPLKLSNTSLNSIVDAELVDNPQYKEYAGTLDGIRSKIPGGEKISHGPSH